MASRNIDLYSCDECGKTAEGRDVDGDGPPGWLALFTWGLTGGMATSGDFDTEGCALVWLARRKGYVPPTSVAS
jgi:hypothetical protein